MQEGLIFLTGIIRVFFVNFRLNEKKTIKACLYSVQKISFHFRAVYYKYGKPVSSSTNRSISNIGKNHIGGQCVLYASTSVMGKRNIYSYSVIYLKKFYIRRHKNLIIVVTYWQK